MGNFFKKSFVVNEEHLKAPWGGVKNGKNFRCYLCGYRFKLGDIFRSVYTNDIVGASGNPLVCENCYINDDDVRIKWKKMHEESKNKYWWFRSL